MKIKATILSFAESNSVWTNTYGVARSILSLGTLLTLLTNSNDILFKKAAVRPDSCDPFNLSLYCIFDNLLVGKIISIVILALVVSGWRPRFTGLLHCWVMYSLINSASILDGGDHIASIITMLLLPITLTDNRKWHWTQLTSPEPVNTIYGLKNIIAKSCLIIIKVQVSVIYLNAAAAKLAIKEWVDGTAIYYWFKHPLFGYPSWIEPLIEPLILNGTTLFMISWGTMIFEFLLFAGIVMDKRYKKIFLFFGILFHCGIFLIHDLASFLFTMAACLILFLRPSNEPFLLPKIIVNLKNKIYGAISYIRSSPVSSRHTI